jgi:uncharacterized protein (TIGR02145 family)
MAKNLDRATNNSKCYENSADSCAKYGRLYAWVDALLACPVGWHLPSDNEWATLIGFVNVTVGTKLKSSTGWNSYNNVPAGTDEYGFSALPGGAGTPNGGFSNVGDNGLWWSATEYINYSSGRPDTVAWLRNISYDKESTSRNYNVETYLYSVRCVQD